MEKETLIISLEKRASSISQIFSIPVHRNPGRLHSTTVKKKERPLTQSQSLSSDLHITTRSDLKKQDLGMFVLQKGKRESTLKSQIDRLIVFLNDHSIVQKSPIEICWCRESQHATLDFQNFCFLTRDDEFRYPYMVLQGIIAHPTHCFRD